MTVKLPTLGQGGGRGGGRGEHEIWWARGEPHPVHGWHPAVGRREPTPLPKRGDHVLYRSNDWFEPIDAEVFAVDPDSQDSDPNRGFAHPWPTVRLKIVPPWPEHKLDVSGHRLAGAAGPLPYLVDTRESRLVGSAGWLPLDHTKRVYPEVGF